MGNVIGKLKTAEPLRIPSGAATCQVLDWNKVKCLLQLKRSQRDSNHRARQSEQHTDGHLSPQTSTTAHESLAGKPANLKSCSVRFGYFHIPFQRHQFRRWINKSCSVQQMSGASDICQSSSLAAFLIDSYPGVMWCANGIDLSPVAVSYLLWGREAALHWPGWMSTSWRTPPPRPRHSRSRSTGRRGGTQTQVWGSGEGHRADRRQVWICGWGEEVAASRGFLI